MYFFFQKIKFIFEKMMFSSTDSAKKNMADELKPLILFFKRLKINIIKATLKKVIGHM